MPDGRRVDGPDCVRADRAESEPVCLGAGDCARRARPPRRSRAKSRERVERLNPGIAIHVSELKTRVRERLLNERMVAMLAGVFAILAMTLVVVGLYGIVAYLAASRRSEIGIRLALGSTRRRSPCSCSATICG